VAFESASGHSLGERVSVIAGPFPSFLSVIAGPTIGDRRTFFKTRVGDCRFCKPETANADSPYKAYYKGLLYRQRRAGFARLPKDYFPTTGDSSGQAELAGGDPHQQTILIHSEE
jgi:hypothetical protein